VISTPEPGPSGTMKRTVRVGQAGAEEVCADDGALAEANVAMAQKMKASRRDRRRIVFSSRIIL
jgi:hypothetical protein